jgi:hypothetical protein
MVWITRPENWEITYQTNQRELHQKGLHPQVSEFKQIRVLNGSEPIICLPFPIGWPSLRPESEPLRPVSESLPILCLFLPRLCMPLMNVYELLTNLCLPLMKGYTTGKKKGRSRQTDGWSSFPRRICGKASKNVVLKKTGGKFAATETQPSQCRSGALSRREGGRRRDARNLSGVCFCSSANI